MFQPLSSSRSYVCGRCVAAIRQSQLGVSRKISGSARARHGARQHDASSSALEVLEARGYIKEIAGDRNALNDLLKRKQVGFYAGIDPTAPSLHLGHLLPLMVLFWLYVHGHHAVSLVGGATARVGDPSGRLTSRTKTEGSVLETNSGSLHQQVGRLWERAEAYGRRHGYKSTPLWKRTLLNNADWLLKVNIVEFLQLLGSGMRIGAMLGRDTVKNKMEKGDGMSFAEFSYPLLQGWDWWHMYREHGVQVQIGGSDQYGNIVAGMDAIRYIAQSLPQSAQQAESQRLGTVKDETAPMGLTVPLLTTASGEKFGKSAGNAVWLDRTMTSPFDLYGFLLRSSDDEVERYLKLFTFVPIAEIAVVMEKHGRDPGQRLAQHLLAAEVLNLVHGPEESAKTRAEHQAMRNPSLASLSKASSTGGGDSDVAAPGDSTQHGILPRSLVASTSLAKVIFHAGLVPTRSEGARLVKSGGVYVASSMPGAEDKGTEHLTFVPIKDQKADDVDSYRDKGVLVLRLGKWKVRVIEVVEDEDFESRRADAPGWAEWKARRVEGLSRGL